MALEEWLNRNVETEQYRSRVRCVALGLGDLKACSEEMLSHALNLDDWPLLARHRFLDAWRVLKAEGAAPAPAVAAPAPAAPSPDGEAPADDAPPSSLKRDIHRSGGLERLSARSAPPPKKQKSNTPEEVLQRKREGKTSSRFHGVNWGDQYFEGKGGWQANYWDARNGRNVYLGIFTDETAAALAYNQAVKDAGLEHKMNPVDANGQPIPKPGY